MLWRLPGQGDPNKFAVDTEGRLILANWDGQQTDNVIVNSQLDGYTILQRSDADYPVFEQWGTAPQKAVLTGDFGEFEITFNGQHYNVSESGTEIEPIVEDYQP